MKLLRFLFSFAACATLSLAHNTSSDSKNCGCKCCVGKTVCCCNEETSSETPAKPTDAAQPEAHALKGVIVDVLPDQKALLVKHEEVPGVMKAMTMMLRVDEAALKSATKGRAVTGQLIRRGAVWWLDDVQIVTQE